jgi:hypothetical protein
METRKPCCIVRGEWRDTTISFCCGVFLTREAAEKHIKVLENAPDDDAYCETIFWIEDSFLWE